MSADQKPNYGDGARSADGPRTITIKGVKQRYGWGRSKTYQLLGEGKLKGAKMGTRLLIFVISCQELVASLPAAKFVQQRQTRRAST